MDENVTFQGNESEIAYWITDDDDIAQHNSLVKATQFTGDFLYGYNNSDINYTRGEPLEYATVTFDLNYPGGGVYTRASAHPYQPVPRPEDPDREGYSFAGWFTQEETKWNFTSGRVEENTTLYAHWTAKTYDVIYHYNDGTGTTSETTARFGNKLNEPQAPTRSGYTFEGWAMENQTIWDFETNTMPAYTLNLYAQWAENTTSSSSSSSEASSGSGGDSSQETSNGSSSSEASSGTGGNGGDSSQEPGGGSSSGGTSSSTGSTVTPPASGSSSSSVSTASSSGSQSTSTGTSSQSDSTSSEPAAPPEDNGEDNNRAGGYTVNEDGSITYTAPDGSEVTLADGTYTILENGAILDHNPGSPYYVEDNGTLDLFGSPTPLGGLASVGGWGLVNLLLALLALASTAVQLVRSLLQKRIANVLRIIAMASGLLPLLFFLVLENKAQMLLFTKWTPLILALLVVHIALFAVSTLRGKQAQKPESAE